MDYRCVEGWFHCPPSIVKFQARFLKTSIWNERYGFSEVQTTNIAVHLEETDSSIALKQNLILSTLFKYLLEYAILDK